MLAEAVYALCIATCVGVAVLLLRAYARTRARLLFWSGLCFSGLACNNVVLFLDLVVWTQVDLSLLRSVIALASLSLLLFGLIWERT